MFSHLFGKDSPSKHHRYRVRPGYGSKLLLIEFVEDSENTKFTTDLKKVLDDASVKVKKQLFQWDFNSTLHCLKGPFGKCELSADDWGGVFIVAEQNQSAIRYLDNVLLEKGRFEKEEMDPEDYDRTDSDP